VEVDATLPPPVDLISVQISPNVRLCGEHVAMIDTKHVKLGCGKRNQVESTKMGEET